MEHGSDEGLRALIRLIPPAQALRDELEESISLERHHGTGDMALKTFQGLQESVSSLASDPYIKSLSISVPEGATDKEKVSLVKLAASQLLAYLEGQTGLVGAASGEGNHHSNRSYQMAPTVNITLNNLKGVPSETIGKIVELGEQAMKDKHPHNDEDHAD